MNSIISFYLLPYWRSFKRLVHFDDDVKVLSEVDQGWLESVFNRKIRKYELESMAGGIIGGQNIVKLDIQFQGDSNDKWNHYIIKTCKENYDAIKTAIGFGMGREGIFYSLNKGTNKSVQYHLPQIYYATGSAYYGNYLIIMDNLSGDFVSGSKLLGNQCWGPVNDIPSSFIDSLDRYHLIKNIYETIAKLHANHWRDFKLLDIPYLKNRDILSGGQNARVPWEASLRSLDTLWKSQAKKVFLSIGDDKLEHSDQLIQLMEKMLSESTFESFQSKFNIQNIETGFTMTHGDFHAANLLISTKNPLSNFHLIDWSEVGIFCPFTDIAQFCISNIPIDFRREHEESLFKCYYEALVSNNTKIDRDIFTLQKCYNRYKVGGIERWLQFITMMAPALPENANIFFHNQVSTFIHDHYNDSIKSDLSTFYTSYRV
ncbi:hypothetical protein DLAC_07074 [Tieghemostelium lacteum]|uniref:CHK kinase-like domain-containing protein n=1 Tax=Tieghemostelium lacteum TaxID=361077 RepID=A0A151ZE66_TIELA|nr:hypothetical protein DLAC_07074 [Tieghemostelium lacteum]|eukprot:KYQ92227.1 hypothetical protein DLAC_07074 [Tieghemostelium lacteum]